MKKHFKGIIGLALVLCLFAFGPASAGYIVNTAPVPDEYDGWSLFSDLSGTQWLAAQFEIGTGETYNITSIEGWIGYDYPYESTTFTAAIYGNSGTLPDTGTEYYAGQFTVPEVVGGAGNYNLDWYGPSGISGLTLTAGTYWVSFEVRAGDDFYGFMPYPAENPLSPEAVYNGYGWYNTDLNLGVRIWEGPSAAVPVPAAVWLLGSGLLGLVGLRRRSLG